MTKRIIIIFLLLISLSTYSQEFVKLDTSEIKCFHETLSLFNLAVKNPSLLKIYKSKEFSSSDSIPLKDQLNLSYSYSAHFYQSFGWNFEISCRYKDFKNNLKTFKEKTELDPIQKLSNYSPNPNDIIAIRYDNWCSGKLTDDNSFYFDIYNLKEKIGAGIVYDGGKWEIEKYTAENFSEYSKIEQRIENKTITEKNNLSNVISSKFLAPDWKNNKFVDGAITFTSAKIEKMSNGVEYLVIENPKFNENHKKYKSIQGELPFNIDQPNYNHDYLEVWQKYSKFKNLRVISYLSTFLTGDAATNYYNYFKNYELITLFKLAHYVYFDNNDMSDDDWELFKSEIRNPQVELMKNELISDLNKYKEKQTKDNDALLSFLSGVYEYGKGVATQMKESLSNVDLVGMNNSTKANNTSNNNCEANQIPTYTIIDNGLKSNGIVKYQEYFVKFDDKVNGKIEYYINDKEWYMVKDVTTIKKYNSQENAIRALYIWQKCSIITNNGK